MKQLFIFFLLSAMFVSCAQKTPKVLIFIRDGSIDLEYMLTAEVAVMKDILEGSGFETDIATVTGDSITESLSGITPNLKVSDVVVSDYQGFILPCMAAGTNVPPEGVTLVEDAVMEGKPVAAQLFAVRILARAGVLEGKRYACYVEMDTIQWPDYKGAIYAGRGVIQDGLILTSGICPYMGRMDTIQNGTVELTQMLVDVINARSE